MISKFFGALFVIAAVVVGFSMLVMLIGMVIGLLWFAAKVAVVCRLAYFGYRFLFEPRHSMTC